MKNLIAVFLILFLFGCKEKLELVHTNPFDDNYVGEPYIFLDSVEQLTSYTLDGQGDTTFSIDLKAFAHTTYACENCKCAFYWNGFRQYPKDASFTNNSAFQFLYNFHKGDIVTLQAALSNNVDVYSKKSEVLTYTVK